MITALQDVSNVSAVNVAPVRDRAALTGEVRPLPATPSAIVVLGGALPPILTFNPVTPGTPGTPDITPLVISGPGSPTTPSGVIANTVPTLAGAPNTATFALPPSVAAAPGAVAEVEAAIPLAASANTFAPSAPTVAAGPTTDQAENAAQLSPAALANTRIGTPEPAAATVPVTTATAQAEAVLSALNDSSATTVTAAPNVVGIPRTTTTDAPPATPASPVAANAIATPTATTTTIASNVGGTLPPDVPAASTGPTQASTAARGAGILTPVDVVTNPFYPAMAASLYLSAMSFRLQQSSAAELNSPADSVQMVGGVRAVSGVESDRQGPADDFRNMTRTFA